MCLSVSLFSICLRLFCILYFLLISVLIWTTSLDEQVAFPVDRHCVSYCFIVRPIHFDVVVAQLAKQID